MRGSDTHCSQSAILTTAAEKGEAKTPEVIRGSQLARHFTMLTPDTTAHIATDVKKIKKKIENFPLWRLVGNASK